MLTVDQRLVSVLCSCSLTVVMAKNRMLLDKRLLKEFEKEKFWVNFTEKRITMLLGLFRAFNGCVIPLCSSVTYS